MTTVLKAETFAATPAMNAASRPVIASPSMPLGRYSFISSGIALLYCRSGFVAAQPGDRDQRDHARDHVIAGMKIFG